MCKRRSQVSVESIISKKNKKKTQFRPVSMGNFDLPCFKQHWNELNLIERIFLKGSMPRNHLCSKFQSECLSTRPNLALLIDEQWSIEGDELAEDEDIGSYTENYASLRPTGIKKYKYNLSKVKNLPLRLMVSWMQYLHIFSPRLPKQYRNRYVA